MIDNKYFYSILFCFFIDQLQLIEFFSVGEYSVAYFVRNRVAQYAHSFSVLFQHTVLVIL